MKHLWIYAVFLMVLNFQRIPASDVCFSNEQTCNCTSPLVTVRFPERPSFCDNPVMCTVPPLQGKINSSCTPNTSVSYNERCNFSCPTGCNLVGPSSVTCTGSGNFSEPFPECEDNPVMCTIPPLQGKVNSSCTPNTSVSYNERCNFSCPTGCNLVGPSSVTCTGSGNFSEPFPECVEITCTVPPLHDNVTSSCTPNTSVSYNERCNFSCRTNYSRAGPSFVNCTGSGNFSQMFPRCVECDSYVSDCPESVKTCTVPEFDEMVSSMCSTGEYVIVNEQCSFSCPTGYSLAGPSSVNCTGSGNFWEPFPHCVDIDDCAPRPCLNGGTCTDGVNSYSCSCAAGYSGMNCSIVDCTDGNPCRNGGTCENNACTCASGFTGRLCDEECVFNESDCPKPSTNSPPDDFDKITLAIALSIAFLLLVAIGCLACVYHRYGMVRGRKGRVITPEPLVQEGTPGAGLQQSSSVDHLPLGDNLPLAHEFNDGLEMGSRLNSDDVDRHDVEVKGLSYRQTVDDNGFSNENQASSGTREKESDLNEVPQKELRV